MERTAFRAATPLTALHGGAAGRDSAALPSYAALFESVARALPNELAVDDGTVALTYAELDRRSGALAAGLQEAVPDAATPVAVLTGCDSEAIATDLGVIRSGRPIVVLDRLVPVPRIRTILEIAGSALLLADDASRELADEVAAGLDVEVRSPDEVVGRVGSDARPAPVSPEDAGVIIFTSGSTGKPKGVVWSQRFMAADSLVIGEQFGYRVGDRLSASFPINFAAGMLGSLVALAWGVSLQMCDPRDVGAAGFVEWLRATRSTLLSATPSMLRVLLRTLEPGDVLGDLRLVMSAGEALYGTDVEGMRPHMAPGAEFVQSLGSSEGGALAYLVIGPRDPVPVGAVPAGGPAIWRSLRLVDDDGRTLPPGEPGELVVATPVLASGYWRDPERSAARFQRRDDGLWDLRTGDVGVLTDEGVLRLMGRKETAVKVRGYLVDPSEIEATLLASGRVAESVVVATTDGPVTQLVAYVVPKPGERTASVAELRAWLGSKLPSWMVPTHVVPMRELPHNAGGKVDRPALPPVPPRRYVAPENRLERQIAEIWAEVLNVPDIGRADDFFAVGGDSLAVEEMLVRVEDRLAVSFQTSDFTQVPVLADFAARVAGDIGNVAAPRWPGTTIELRHGTSDRTIFCVAGAAASAVVYGPLAAGLRTDDSIVVFQMRGYERRAPAEWSVRGMVRRRVAAMRRIQPHGPYVLVGHSLGAILVLEMARQLKAMGEEVLPVLLDPIFGSSTLDGRPRSDLLDMMVSRRWGRRPGAWGSVVWLAKCYARLGLVPFAGLLPKKVDARHQITYKQSGVAARRHQPQPWHGPALAYRTVENDDAPAVWSHLLPEAHVRHLTSDHNSLLRTPYVEVIVADLQEVLGAAA